MSADDAVATQTQLTNQTASKQHFGAARLPLSKPCNSPYCRSAPFQSTPTSPVNISLPSDRLAVFGHMEVQLTRNSQFRHAGEPDACPTPGFKARIEHPPRA
jgi:hypothetical protein